MSPSTWNYGNRGTKFAPLGVFLDSTATLHFASARGAAGRRRQRRYESIAKIPFGLINLNIMKISPRFLLPFLACALAATAAAAPIDFSEVSLLVRSGDNENSILQQVSERKLMRPLNAQEEATLKKQGASDALVGALRKPNVALTAADAASFDARREEMRKKRNATAMAAAQLTDAEPAEGLHVFEVATGHPINLSQWGGPDYELAFHAPTRLDEGREDAILIDNVSSGTHVATYLGAGRTEDSTTIFDRRNYVSVVDHSFTRGLRIDHAHPVSMKGSPYLMYPVYAAGGVSLYYIGGGSDSVKLAVSTSVR